MTEEVEEIRTDNGRRKSRRPKIAIITIAIMAIVVIGFGISYAKVFHDNPGIPREVTSAQSSDSIPAYFPVPLPPGFRFQEKSTKVSAMATIYNLTFNKQVISVTAQQVPKGVVFDDFYNRLLKNKADVFNIHGKAAIGTADDKIIGSLISKDIWILVNAPSSVDAKSMTMLLSNLSPVTSSK